MAVERILIAEDSKSMVDFLQGYLEQQGYAVQAVPDGETAVQLFDARPFDLVLTDLAMPRLDGLEVLHRVKARDRLTQVIILTGHASLDSALDALRHGAYDYLLKPVDNIDRFRFTIERALRERRLQLENQRLLQELQAAKAHLELKVAEQTRELREAYDQLQRARRHEIQNRNARLATGLLHQINNAVATIPELVDELEALRLPEPAHALLKELRLNALAAAHIRTWLHQFVQIGNLSLDWVDVVALAEEIQQRLEKQRRRPPQVHVSKVAVIGHMPEVHADRELIAILIENLLRNAYEAVLPTARFGGVVVEISAEGPYCVMRFRDNGIGIREDDRDAIWEWGWTTKQKTLNAHDRGLGLYACREIAAAHDGVIELEYSTPSQGTCFTVHLPIAGPQRVTEK